MSLMKPSFYVIKAVRLVNAVRVTSTKSKLSEHVVTLGLRSGENRARGQQQTQLVHWSFALASAMEADGWVVDLKEAVSVSSLAAKQRREVARRQQCKLHSCASVLVCLCASVPVCMCTCVYVSLILFVYMSAFLLVRACARECRSACGYCMCVSQSVCFLVCVSLTYTCLGVVSWVVVAIMVVIYQFGMSTVSHALKNCMPSHFHVHLHQMSPLVPDNQHLQQHSDNLAKSKRTT
jgi:hypothetical protein